MSQQENNPAQPIPAMQRPPIRTLHLDYERVQQGKGKMQIRDQYVSGILLPLAFAWLACPALYFAPILAIIFIPLFVALVIAIRVKTGWTAFVPGVLTAVFVLPIAFFVLCGIITCAAGFHG